jgi:hypothetical protein
MQDTEWPYPNPVENDASTPQMRNTHILFSREFPYALDTSPERVYADDLVLAKQLQTSSALNKQRPPPQGVDAALHIQTTEARVGGKVGGRARTANAQWRTVRSSGWKAIPKRGSYPLYCV